MYARNDGAIGISCGLMLVLALGIVVVGGWRVREYFNGQSRLIEARSRAVVAQIEAETEKEIKVTGARVILLQAKGEVLQKVLLIVAATVVALTTIAGLVCIAVVRVGAERKVWMLPSPVWVQVQDVGIEVGRWWIWVPEGWEQIAASAGELIESGLKEE